MAEPNIASTIPDVVITRTFDAPRTLVFDAWTDPAQMAKWWGPAGWWNPVCEMDVRPGGKILIHMEGRGFPVSPMKGEFIEVARPSKLVMTAKIGESPEGVFGVEMVTTVTFAEHDGQTTLVISERVTHAVAAMLPALAGQKAGMNQSLDRLMGHLSNCAEFVITRLFDAPRNLVWEVYTKPEHLAKWWGPKGLKMLSVDVDLRVGGIFHYGMEAPDGSQMWGKFIYREIDAPERLSFVVSFSDPQRGVTRHPLAATWPQEVYTAVTFFPVNGKTALIMAGMPVNATEEERAMFYGALDSMRQGFKGTLDQLEAYLAAVGS
jgi:uncharacterized protein YndB with AHSA1/START domain